MPLFLLSSTKWQRAGLALLAGALALPARAQVTATQPRAQPYYLDLSKQELSVPGRALYVEQVLDGRVGHPTIGLIYRGLYDKQAPVMFRQSLETELTAWLQQQLPARPTDHAVVLCVRQLGVSETVRGASRGAVASADLVADVYAHQPDGYHFVRSVAERIGGKGIYMNGNHIEHLAQAMQQCLLQVTEADWARPARQPARSLAQLPADKPQGMARPAILRAAVPRRGVYFNLEQFTSNQPDTTTELHVDTVGVHGVTSIMEPGVAGGNASGWKGTAVLRARLRNAKGDRISPREVWGFSDGRQAYFHQINSYRPLTQQGDFYTFVGATPVDVTAASKRTMNSLVGGSPAAYTGPDDKTGQPMVYSLDIRTGQTVPFPSSGQAMRHDTAFVYIYRPLGGPAEPQRLLVNDHIVGQLRPGEYLEIPWPHFGRVMRLGVGTPGGAAMLVAPSTATATYIKLQPSSAYTPWYWMPSRRGEAEVDALDRARK